MARIQTTIRNARRPGGISAITGGVGSRIADRLDPIIRGRPADAPTDTGNIYEVFYRNLLASTNSLSLKPLWVCFLDNMPGTTFGANVDTLDKNTAAGNHQFASGASNAIEGISNEIGKLAESTTELNGAKGALICQECQVPGEGYKINNPRIENTGGFLAPAVGSNREDFSPLKTAYLETNYSFTDIKLRPWLINLSYNSLKYTPRTNITMIKFGKAGPGVELVPIKIIRFFGCCPIDIDTEPYTYKDQSITIRQVEWHYDAYTMDFSKAQINQIERQRPQETLVGQLLDDFLGEQKPGTPIGERLGSFASDAIQEGRSFVANRAGQLITSNFQEFGRRLEEMTGARSTLPRTSRSGIGVNDTPSVSPQNDDVRIPENDTPSGFDLSTASVNEKSFDEVVNEQAVKAKNVQFDKVEIQQNTPFGLDVEHQQVNIDPNDVPPPGRAIQDSIRIPENDTPNTLAN